MWLRCRNSQSGHEASIPVGLVEIGAMPDWAPIEGAEPSAMPADPVYNTALPEKSAKSDEPNKEI